MNQAVDAIAVDDVVGHGDANRRRSVLMSVVAEIAREHRRIEASSWRELISRTATSWPGL